METAFELNFEKTDVANRVFEMNGYLQALRAMYAYIQDTTGSNPDNRYIDAVGLLEKINATCEAFRPLFVEETRAIIRSMMPPTPNFPTSNN